MINSLLTQQQIFQIVRIIENQCRRFQSFEDQYDSLFYEPYTQMRHKHAATSAIISGFAPGQFEIDGITSTDLNYGLQNKLVQPELHCEKGIIHIYSDGSDLKGRKILERCSNMNSDLTMTPLFFMIIVHVNRAGILHKIEICLPDKYGTIVEKATIYQSSKANPLTA